MKSIQHSLLLWVCLMPCLLQAQTAGDYKKELDQCVQKFEQASTLKEKRAQMKKIYSFVNTKAMLLIHEYVYQKFAFIHQQVTQNKQLAPLLPLATVMWAQNRRSNSAAEGAELYFQALELAKQYKDKEVLFDATHAVLCDLANQSKFKEVLTHFHVLEALINDPELKEHMQNMRAVSLPNLYCVIAQIYVERLEKPDFVRAEAYYQKAIQAAKATHDQAWIGMAHGNMSKLYLLQNNLEKWREYLLIDVKYSLQATNYGSVVGAYTHMVRTYTKQKNYTEAKACLDSLERLITTPLAPSKLDSQIDTAKIYQEFYFFYSATEQYEKAVKANNKYLEISKRNNEVNYKKDFEEIQTKYKVKFKEQEFQSLQKQKDAERWILYLVVLVTVSVIALAFVLFRHNRRQAKTNALLQEQQEELNTQKDFLEIQAQALDTANKTKDQLFAIIAHDLRSPMVAFQTLNKQIQHLVRKNQPEKLQELGQKIENASGNLNALLNNLLQWAVVQKQAVRLHPENIRLHEAVAHSLSHFEWIAENQQVRLENWVGENVVLCTDYQALQTILRNLLSNALKFTPEAGKITVAFSEQGRQGVISVTDTGVGIASEKLAHLFDNLHLQSEAGVRGEKGVGIGLQLCYELAQQIGANLTCESEVGKGTTFRVEGLRVES